MTDTNPNDTTYVLEMKAVSLQEFLPTPTFEEYREQFKDFFILDCRDDGVLLAQAHTRGCFARSSTASERSTATPC